MTILTQKNTITHVALAAQDTFIYDFRVDNADDMQPWVDGIEIEIGFTVTGLQDPSGGTVIFDTPMTGGENVTLQREVSLTQEVDYTPYDPFPAQTHEAALDKLTMQTQQVSEKVGRGITAPPGSPSDVDYTMPPYEANKCLVWSPQPGDKELQNSDSEFDTIVPDAEAARDAAAASAGAAASSAADSATSADNASDSEDAAGVSAGEAAVSAALAQDAVPTISMDAPSGGVDGDVWYQYGVAAAMYTGTETAVEGEKV